MVNRLIFLLISIDKDGTREGYDLHLIKQISQSIKIPVVALGGAKDLQNMRLAFSEGGAYALAAGSIFVFHGPRRAVLIKYPTQKMRKEVFK